MVIHTLGQMPSMEGSIDEVIELMIKIFGKDKCCEQTNTIILSFEDHENTCATRKLATRIRKVISRHKDNIFGVKPNIYTFKDKE